MCGSLGSFASETKALDVDLVVVIVFILGLQCHATEMKTRSRAGYCLVSESSMRSEGNGTQEILSYTGRFMELMKPIFLSSFKSLASFFCD